jgi:predicted MFS family arabinose efflux permease
MLFWANEARTPEPVIPLSLFRRRVIVVSSMITFLAGGLSIGVSSFVPLFEQGVFGGTPIQAGIVIAPMSVSWIIGSVMSGKVIIKYGFFHSAMVGGVLVVLGSSGFLLQADSNSILVASVAGFWLGIGMGFVTNCTVVSVQNSVSWDQRGSATATLQFFRTIGGSISVAILGSLLNARMEGRLEGIADLPEGRKAELLLRESTRSQVAPTR